MTSDAKPTPPDATPSVTVGLGRIVLHLMLGAVFVALMALVPFGLAYLAARWWPSAYGFLAGTTVVWSLAMIVFAVWNAATEKVEPGTPQTWPWRAGNGAAVTVGGLVAVFWMGQYLHDDEESFLAGARRDAETRAAQAAEREAAEVKIAFPPLADWLPEWNDLVAECQKRGRSEPIIASGKVLIWSIEGKKPHHLNDKLPPARRATGPDDLTTLILVRDAGSNVVGQVRVGSRGRGRSITQPKAEILAIRWPMKKALGASLVVGTAPENRWYSLWPSFSGSISEPLWNTISAFATEEPPPPPAPPIPPWTREVGRLTQCILYPVSRPDDRPARDPNEVIASLFKDMAKDPETEKLIQQTHGGAPSTFRAYREPVTALDKAFPAKPPEKELAVHWLVSEWTATGCPREWTASSPAWAGARLVDVRWSRVHNQNPHLVPSGELTVVRLANAHLARHGAGYQLTLRTSSSPLMPRFPTDKREARHVLEGAYRALGVVPP